MHIADGVLSFPVVAGTYAATAGCMIYSARKVKEDDIPKIALMSGTFFAASLLSIPVPPSSVHPLLCGLIGIMLGSEAVFAFFPALLLQALLFKHGGLTSLGANTVLLHIPAVLSSLMYRHMKMKPFAKGTIVGFLSVCMTVIILIGILFITDESFAQGDFSVIRIVTIGHAPLAIVEGLLTGAIVQFMEKSAPDWIWQGA